MTPVYEVRTKHTEQVLKDFISFKEAERNAHITFRLVMLGICVDLYIRDPGSSDICVCAGKKAYRRTPAG